MTETGAGDAPEDGRSRGRSADGTARIEPKLVVKFHDDVELPHEGEVEPDRIRKVGPWDRLSAEFPGIRLRGWFSRELAERLPELTDRARRADPSYDPPNLRNYFAVDGPEEVDAAALRNRIALEWTAVEHVGLLPRPGVPADVHPDQEFLLGSDESPPGIGASAVTDLPGGRGQGVHLAEIENGWYLHKDLPPFNATGGVIQPAYGDPSTEVKDLLHGTRVLGMILADQVAAGGIVGIAPGVASATLLSALKTDSAGNLSPDVPGAILHALAHSLGPGDVLLIEAQYDLAFAENVVEWVPVEYHFFDFEFVRLATALGVVVVEAAGNGKTQVDDEGTKVVLGQKLESITGSYRPFDPEDPAFEDSGAILVAAADVPSLARRATSNYGARIDCFGWGQLVYTCGAADDPQNGYDDDFGGTSAAAAMVAGAALCVQGLFEAIAGFRLSPLQVRHLFRTTGTESPNVAEIKRMPDLHAIADAAGLLPDVYLRDNPNDSGADHDFPVSSSPDVFVLHAPPADAQSEHGEYSVTQDLVLPAEVVSNQPNLVFTRVRNRGGVDAQQVKVRVYYDEPVTLLAPPWNFVGETSLPVVPATDQLTVAAPIDWNTGLPPDGHYCFIALVGVEGDPVFDLFGATSTFQFHTWERYREYIRAHNNVTWRNFNVVTYLQTSGETSVVLSFALAGAPDRAHEMALDVSAHLPQGSRLLLGDADELLPTARLGRAVPVRIGRDLFLELGPRGLATVFTRRIAAGGRLRLRLVVQLPDGEAGEHVLFARQVYSGKEVGRVTWRLVPRKAEEPRDDD